MEIKLSLAAVLIILLIVNFILVNLLNWVFRLATDSEGTGNLPIVLTIIWLFVNIALILELTKQPSKNQSKPNLLIKTEIIGSVQYYSLIKDDKVYDFITYEEADSINKLNN